MTHPKALQGFLTDIEMKIFSSAYRRFSSEEDLASGFGGGYSEAEFLWGEIIEHTNMLEVKTGACIRFSHGYDITSKLGLKLSIARGDLAKTSKEQLDDIVERNLPNFYCYSAQASITKEQKKNLSLGNTSDKWLLWLISAHADTELARHMQSNLKSCNSLVVNPRIPFMLAKNS